MEQSIHEILEGLKTDNPLIYQALETLILSCKTVAAKKSETQENEDTTGGEHPPLPPNHP
jgi:hypothetical protein